MKIDGKKIAQDILENLKKRVGELKKKKITPKLAIILIGNGPASLSYVRQKELKAKSIGIKTKTYKLDYETKNEELVKLINKLNKDKTTHGIIVQRPLPSQINSEKISLAVNPKKDVDGFNPKSQFEIPIAAAVLEILKIISLPIPFIEWLNSKSLVVIGKGETGGKQIINMFNELGVKPLIIDSKTKNPENLTKKADILISSVGKKDIVRPEMIKKGVILIGVGMHKEADNKLRGDYEEEKIKNIASFYTPTPGGVGPANVAMLLRNVVLAAENS